MKRGYVALPDYAIGADVYDKAPALLKKYGKTAVIVGGKRAMTAAADTLERALERGGVSVVGRVWYGGDSTYEKNGSCVGICTGVTCNTAKGFKPVAYSSSCCCERTSCAAGQYLNGTSCVSCPKGTYSAGGTETSCTSCPSGQTTDSTGATSSSACHTSRKTCEAGTYVNGDTCTPCPAGTYSSYPNASRCSSCDTIYTGSNDVGKYYSYTKYNGTTCYTICNNCTATGVCVGSNFIENQSSACFTPVSSGDGCPEGSTRKKMYFCNSLYGDGRYYDGDPFYVCDYGDYGKKCTKPSECKSGVCTGTSTLADSNHKCTDSYFYQGSICH